MNVELGIESRLELLFVINLLTLQPRTLCVLYEGGRSIALGVLDYKKRAGD